MADGFPMRGIKGVDGARFDLASETSLAALASAIASQAIVTGTSGNPATQTLSVQGNNEQFHIGSISRTTVGDFFVQNLANNGTPFNMLSLELASAGSGGQVRVYGSNGGNNWYLLSLSQNNKSYSSNLSALNIVTVEVPYAWVKVSLEGSPSGTYTIDAHLTKAPFPSRIQVMGSGLYPGAFSFPVGIALCAKSSAQAIVSDGQTVNPVATLDGTLTQKPYSIPQLDWSYAAAAGGIINTTGVTIKAVAGAGIRNYITAIQIANASATATDVQIRDGAGGTVIWRGYASANMPLTPIPLPSPIKGSANTLVEAACGTTGAAVYLNAQGYSSGAMA